MKRKDTKMNIKIEKMTLDDFEQIKNCLTEEFDDFWSPTMLKQELENKQNLSSHYFVAKACASFHTSNENECTEENKLSNILNKNEPSENDISSKDEIVGFAGITIVIDEVNIMNIVVRKDKRNLGIGSLLLEAIIQFVKEQNALDRSITPMAPISSITLEVNEKNLPAINLYKKYGFQQIGVRKKYYNNSDDALIMNLII